MDHYGFLCRSSMEYSGNNKKKPVQCKSYRCYFYCMTVLREYKTFYSLFMNIFIVLTLMKHVYKLKVNQVKHQEVHSENINLFITTLKNYKVDLNWL